MSTLNAYELIYWRSGSDARSMFRSGLRYAISQTLMGRSLVETMREVEGLEYEIKEREREWLEETGD